MKTIHVKLSDKTVDFIVAEETWQHNLLKFKHVFDHKLGAGSCPVYYFVELIVVLYEASNTLRI